MKRLSPFNLISALVLSSLLSSFSLTAKTVTDVVGRTVDVPDNVERIILGEGRFIPTMAILEQEKVFDRIIATVGDYKRMDPDSYQLYHDKFPQLANIPVIGRSDASTFSVEKAITSGADLAIFGIEGHGPGARNKNIISQLESAGIAVIFIDFRRQPLKNTKKSMTLLGQVLGKEQQARQFNQFYQQEMDKVSSIVNKLKAPQPTVFIHSRVGLSNECCETMVDGMLGHLIDFAGGNNISKPIMPGIAGVVNYEYLLTNQPDIYIATAIGSSTSLKKQSSRVALGAGVNQQQAQQSLKHAIGVYKLEYLSSVEHGQAYSIWHHFYNTPLHVAAIQQMAKWFYPDEFSQLNPETTLKTMHEKFLPIAYQGTYWAQLDTVSK